MSHPVDPFKPVRFYDDRNKLEVQCGFKYLIMSKMIFLDNKVCVCMAFPEGTTPMSLPDYDSYVMFRLDTGEVLTNSWEPHHLYAENY